MSDSEKISENERLNRVIFRRFNLIHYSCAFYLTGCLAYLEGKYGGRIQQLKGENLEEFSKKFNHYKETGQGISKETVPALVEIRNAFVHNNGDLAKNKNKSSKVLVEAAKIPGVIFSGTEVVLQEDFFEFTRRTLGVVSEYCSQEKVEQT